MIKLLPFMILLPIIGIALGFSGTEVLLEDSLPQDSLWCPDSLEWENFTFWNSRDSLISGTSFICQEIVNPRLSLTLRGDTIFIECETLIWNGVPVLLVPLVPLNSF